MELVPWSCPPPRRPRVPQVALFLPGVLAVFLFPFSNFHFPVSISAWRFWPPHMPPLQAVEPSYKFGRNLEGHRASRPKWFDRDAQLPAGKGFRLKVPRPFLGRENALLCKRDDQETLAPKESVELWHCQVTRVVGPYEARVASLHVGTTRNAKQSIGRVAHAYFIRGVDLRHTLPVRRYRAVESPPNRKSIRPLERFHLPPNSRVASPDVKPQAVSRPHQPVLL